MRKILIPAIVIFVLAVLLGVYYFNAVFLPKTLRTIINEKANEFLQRDLTYTSIEYRLGQGLTISGLKVSQQKDPQKILFKAERVFSNIPVIPLVKEKKIIFPQIVVEGFEASLFRIDENTWNISDLLSQKPQKAEKGFNILLGKIKHRALTPKQST